MKDCSRFEASIEAHLAGELNGTELEALERHCQACERCRELLAMHRELAEWGPELIETDETELQSMRRAVLSELERDDHAAGPVGWWRRLVVPVLLRPAPALAAALLLLALGVGLGRVLMAPPTLDDQSMHRELARRAAANQRLSDVIDSPYRLSNVSFRQRPDGLLALNFDVATHMSLVEPADSPLVREVMVQSLLNPSNLGTRLKAVSYADQRMDNKLAEGLAFAMLHDDNLAVRLRAMSILSQRPTEPFIQHAVLQALHKDEAVQMRLLALEYLAGQGVDGTLIREAIGEQDAAVWLRAADLQTTPF